MVSGRSHLSGVVHEIGLALIPEHRGQGIGTAAQQLIVDYLLDHTTVHRIEGITNDGNVGEQKVLQRLGFSWKVLCAVARSFGANILAY